MEKESKIPFFIFRKLEPLAPLSLLKLMKESKIPGEDSLYQELIAPQLGHLKCLSESYRAPQYLQTIKWFFPCIFICPLIAFSTYSFLSRKYLQSLA